LRYVVPIASEAPATVRESRLVLRVLAVWRYARSDDGPPRAGSLHVGDMGDDADHIFVIDVTHAAGPCFTHIGAAVCVADWPGERVPLVADCPEDSVLGLVAHQWREIADRGVPVTRGGSGVNDGEAVLYRGILMPLVDETGRISTIMGAANWRAVEESHGAARD
jgi:hypothetical protein